CASADQHAHLGTLRALNSNGVIRLAIAIEIPGESEVHSQLPKMYVAIGGSGVSVVKRETDGRKGKDETGEAKTREAKLGCVFTQTTVDDEGYAVRDEDSTTYVGAIETAERFGPRIYAEAVRRGIARAE